MHVGPNASHVMVMVVGLALTGTARAPELCMFAVWLMTERYRGPGFTALACLSGRQDAHRVQAKCRKCAVLLAHPSGHL